MIAAFAETPVGPVFLVRLVTSHTDALVAVRVFAATEWGQTCFEQGEKKGNGRWQQNFFHRDTG
jgi:hypothetical protein